MGYKQAINGCNTCGDEKVVPSSDCTVTLDTSCIFYRWKSSDEIALNCLGLTAGTDLTTILEEIDRKLCEFSGFNLEGYQLGCLTDLYDIYSFQNFAEAISKEVCELKAGEYGYKLDTINANLNFINKPKLDDTCIGYSTGDTIQNVLQKLLDKVCELDSLKSNVVSSPEISTIPSTSVQIELCGEKNHTIKADVKVSNLAGNKVKVLDSGLYVPSLSDADIGALLDRINSVPALKEKLCNICSFNQGVGGSSNARVCQCSIKIESVARYNGNNYSVIINTVDMGVAPYHWEVRNNLNIIVASGDTASESSVMETFQMPVSVPTGTYTIRYSSLNCECTDVKSFIHDPSQSIIVAPKITSAVQLCDEDKYVIIVSTVAGTNPEVTTIIRNSSNQVIHTRTNNLSYNEYEIASNGIYTVTVYDSDNNEISSVPYVINFTCIGTVEPPEDICVTYNVINFSATTQTIYYTDCEQVATSAILDAEDNAVLCMIRNSFNENENVTFTEIADSCEAACSFVINSAIVECI